MARSDFDTAVVGGGPGGYIAAIRAAQLGMRTVLVEREHLGGVCLNWGCIPTKALLRSAEIRHLLATASVHGIKTKGVEIDAKRLVARSRDVADRLSKGVEHLLKKNKIETVMGEAMLAGVGRLQVRETKGKERQLSARDIIFATGARAKTFPGIEPDGKVIWTYKEAMVPPEIPKSLLVIGSGAIGMEFASFYADLGSKVTVVEVLDRILPSEDEEISELARKAFEAQGMRLLCGTKVKSLATSRGRIKAEVEGADGKAESLSANRGILAVGITGNVEGLGLEKAGIKVENGHVVTDGCGGTGVAGLHAIGDLAGPPWLAHKASHEGIACIERIAGGEPHSIEVSKIPACTYCRPQVASIGFTEAAALTEGREVKIGRFPFLGNGKAIALGEDEGLVKTVFDAKTGELLGAHMIGSEVTELIQGFSIARTLEATELELMQTVFPHPTLSEMMHESTLAAFGRAIHV